MASLAEMAKATAPRTFELAAPITAEEAYEKLQARAAAFELPFSLKTGIGGKNIKMLLHACAHRAFIGNVKNILVNVRGIGFKLGVVDDLGLCLLTSLLPQTGREQGKALAYKGARKSGGAVSSDHRRLNVHR